MFRLSSGLHFSLHLYRKSYCTTSVVGIGVGINKTKFYIKVFKILYFLNPQIDLFCI